MNAAVIDTNVLIDCFQRGGGVGLDWFVAVMWDRNGNTDKDGGLWKS